MTQFDLDAFLPYRLSVLSERVSREFSALYRARFGISIPEWRVVAHLSQSGPVSVREISARASMDKSKTSRAAGRLEAAGYVTKRPHPEDRRLVALELTPDGRAMVEAIAPLALEFEAEVMSRLGAEAESFRQAVGRLLETSGDTDDGTAPRGMDTR